MCAHVCGYVFNRCVHVRVLMLVAGLRSNSRHKEASPAASTNENSGKQQASCTDLRHSGLPASRQRASPTLRGLPCSPARSDRMAHKWKCEVCKVHVCVCALLLCSFFFHKINTQQGMLYRTTFILYGTVHYYVL
jgi:hypothetical protein